MRDLVELQIAAEAADWDELVTIGTRLGVTPRELAAAHVEALAWSSALKAAANGTLAQPDLGRRQSPADRSRSYAS